MFARVQTLELPAAKLDELAQVARDQLPAARDLPGFGGFHFLIDRDHEKALVISLWETEEQLRQLEANGAAVRDHVETEVGVKSPPAEVFAVAVDAQSAG